MPLEALCKRLESDLKKVAKGQPSEVKVGDLQRLITQYRTHARLEEAEFLPLSKTILGRNANHMAALGLALHVRHASPDLIPAYV